MGDVKNDFSAGSMFRNIMKMALPMMLGQFIQILYNFVDRMYVGRLPDDGHLALTGIGISLPIVMIIMAFSNLCGMGGGPLCSIARGRGDIKDAENILGNSFSLLLMIGVSLTVVCYIFKNQFIHLFGASDVTFPYADDYLTYYLIGTPIVVLTHGLIPFINAQGFGRVSMMTNLVGAVANIILDPIFIFTLGMGVRGAAIATVISQVAAAVWTLSFVFSKKSLLKVRVENLKLRLRTVKRILSLGLAGFVLAITTGFVQIAANKTLQIVGGDIYVSVMTVINSIRELLMLPIHGITHGAVPVIGFNYGAGKYERVREGIRIITVGSFALGLVFYIIVFLMPQYFIRIFNSEPELIRLGVGAFRIYFSAFYFMALQLAGQAVSQALGRAKTAIFFSILRKGVLCGPLTLILPRLWNLGPNGVFIAEPVSDILGGLACYITMIFVVYIPLGRKIKDEQKLLPRSPG